MHDHMPQRPGDGCLGGCRRIRVVGVFIRGHKNHISISAGPDVAQHDVEHFVCQRCQVAARQLLCQLAHGCSSLDHSLKVQHSQVSIIFLSQNKAERRLSSPPTGPRLTELLPILWLLVKRFTVNGHATRSWRRLQVAGIQNEQISQQIDDRCGGGIDLVGVGWLRITSSLAARERQRRRSHERAGHGWLCARNDAASLHISP